MSIDLFSSIRLYLSFSNSLLLFSNNPNFFSVPLKEKINLFDSSSLWDNKYSVFWSWSCNLLIDALFVSTASFKINDSFSYWSSFLSNSSFSFINVPLLYYLWFTCKLLTPLLSWIVQINLFWYFLIILLNWYSFIYTGFLIQLLLKTLLQLESILITSVYISVY